MKFNDRLKHALSIKKMTQAELVKRTGISKSGVSQYVSGEYEPKQDNIFLISKALDVDPAWLMGKDVPMKGIDYKAKQSNPIPLIGTIAAGLPILAQENIEDYFNLDSKVKADFALRIKGDSMINAGIHEEDVVFIRKQDCLENGEIGAILIDGEATLKKFYMESGTIILQAENKGYKPMIFSSGDLKILGKLVAVLSLKE